MNTDSPSDRDDDVISVLVSWDEALAAGELPTSPTEVLQQSNLQKKIACVDLLRRLWPRPSDSLGGNGPVQLDAAVTLPNRIGHFQLRRELGRGGFGIVFLARDSKLGRDVALKVPRTDVLVTPDLRARFRQEAQAAAGLDHPNLVPIYEAGEVGPICYIASAYCAGLSLAQWLQLQRHAVPAADAAELVETLARAVQHAHSRGIIHRDLKPANVLLVSGGVVSGASSKSNPTGDSPLTSYQPKITDFGLAKVLDSETQQTQSGNLLGTPSYMAPEQAEGRRAAIGPGVDVYALGVILYELLTGRPPFQADSTLETLLLLRKEEPLPPSRLRPKLPRDLETICLKCLEKRPADRYASAQDLADDLRRFQNAEPIRARPTGILGRLAKWSRRHPATAALIGVTSLASVMLFTVLVASDVQIRQKQNETEKALKTALEARNGLTKSLDRERRTQYFFRIRLAYASWQENNVAQAELYLDACRPQPGEPDLRGWEWHYLRRLTRSEVSTFRGHADYIGSVAISPNGLQAASISSEGILKVWDANTGKSLFNIGAKLSIGPKYRSLVFSPDGKLLAYASQADNLLRLWSTEDGREVYVLRGCQLAFSPDGKQLASADFPESTVRVYDVKSGTEVRSRRMKLYGPSAFVFRPEGLCLVSAVDKNGHSLQVRNVDSNEDRFTIQLTSSVMNVAFSPDGEWLAFGCDDGAAKLWSAVHGVEVFSVPRHPCPVISVAFSPDSQRLAVGDYIGTLKLLDLKGRQTLALRGHVRNITSLSFSRDGRRLASSGGSDLTAKIWDITKDPETVVLQGHRLAVHGLAFDPASRRLASVGTDGNLKVWDPETGRIQLDVPTEMGLLHDVVFSPKGDQIIVSDYNGGKWTTWDANGRKLTKIETQPGNIGRPGSGGISPYGRHFAALEKNVVNLRNLDTGQLRFALTGHQSLVRTVAFSPNGQRLASASWDKTVKVWDTSSGRELHTLRGHIDRSLCVAFSWDGQLIASGGDEKMMRLWDAQTGELVSEIANRYGRNNVNAMTFSPDGKRLVTGGSSPLVSLWDVETGDEVLTLRTNRVGISVATFSSDGRYLAVVSNDATITVWDALPFSE